MKAHPARPRAAILFGTLLAFALSLQGQSNDVTVATNVPPPNSTINVPAAASSPEKAPETKAEPESKPASPSGRLDYTSFRVVAEKNIFNGSRSGQRMTSTRSSTQQRSVRVESFTLVGTLLSEDKDPVAFFDGTSSEFRKALKAGGRLAGFTVQEILHAGVRLTAGTNTLDIFVGSGMRREDEGLWKSSTGGASYAAGAGAGSDSSYRSSTESNNSYSRSGRTNGSRSGYSRGNSEDSSSSTVSNPASEDVEAIRKRLIEKREKE